MLYDNAANTGSLSKLVTISNIFELGKFLELGFQTVEYLWIHDTEEIIKYVGMSEHMPWADYQLGLRLVTGHEEVSVEENSLSLVSFPELNFLPINLRTLKIKNSRDLTYLPRGLMYHCAQLKTLLFIGCDSLEFIMKDKLPSSLESVEIHNCKKLQCLLNEDDSCASFSLSLALKGIRVSFCPEFTALSSTRRQLFEELDSSALVIVTS